MLPESGQARQYSVPTGHCRAAMKKFLALYAARPRMACKHGLLAKMLIIWISRHHCFSIHTIDDSARFITSYMPLHGWTSYYRFLGHYLLLRAILVFRMMPSFLKAWHALLESSHTPLFSIILAFHYAQIAAQRHYFGLPGPRLFNRERSPGVMTLFMSSRHMSPALPRHAPTRARSQPFISSLA